MSEKKQANAYGYPDCLSATQRERERERERGGGLSSPKPAHNRTEL